MNPLEIGRFMRRAIQRARGNAALLARAIQNNDRTAAARAAAAAYLQGASVAAAATRSGLPPPNVKRNILRNASAYISRILTPKTLGVTPASLSDAVRYATGAITQTTWGGSDGARPPRLEKRERPTRVDELRACAALPPHARRMKQLTHVVPDDRINERCENPSWYHMPHDHTGASEVEVSALIAALAAATRATHVLETGGAFGDTTTMIAKMLHPQQTLWTLELNEKRLEMLRARNLPSNVRVMHGSALTWTPPNGVKFGLAYFDASRNRAGELRHFMRYLECDAIIAFHDAANHHNTAAQIQQLERNGVVHGLKINSPRGIWIGRTTK